MVINIIRNLIQGRFVGTNWVRSSWVPGGTRETAWAAHRDECCDLSPLAPSCGDLLICSWAAKQPRLFKAVIQEATNSPLPHAQKGF